MSINPGFVPPALTAEDALGIFHQAADNLTADGKNHKVMQAAIRVLTESVEKLRALEAPPKPADAAP
jgi:hypothetical protein